MASFKDLIKTGKIKAAFYKKQAILEDVNTHVQLISELDKLAPNARKFARRELEANRVLNDLNITTRELSQLLYEQNMDISKDTDFLEDQKHSRSEMTCLFNEIEDYIAILDKAGIPYPPDVKPSLGHSDIATILDVQSKNIETLLKAQEI